MYYKDDIIRLKTVHVNGFGEQTYQQAGNEFKIIAVVSTDHIDIRSVKNGEYVSITPRYYEIDVLYKYELPEELFELSMNQEIERFNQATIAEFHAELEQKLPILLPSPIMGNPINAGSGPYVCLPFGTIKKYIFDNGLNAYVDLRPLRHNRKKDEVVYELPEELFTI